VPGATASTKEMADAIISRYAPRQSPAATRARRIVKSVAGTNGGYKLIRTPGAVSALEVVRATTAR